MDGVELFLLGRTLAKIGEAAMPEPAGGTSRLGGSIRSVLAVAGDIAAHPDSAVGEIAARTGLPQSAVSTAVARLKEAGAVTTAPDPADRRRLLVRQAPEVSGRGEGVPPPGIDDALVAALGEQADPERVAEVKDALAVLARHLAPPASARVRA